MTPKMNTGRAALLLAIVLVVSSSDGIEAKSGPNYFQDTCAATISLGHGCDAGKCTAVCERRFKGGVGGCEPSGCRCIYACPSYPPVGGEKR